MPQPSCAEQAEKQEVEALALKDADLFKTTVSVNRDIRPILSDKCYNCHSPDARSREAELRLDVAEDGEDYFGAYLVIEQGDPDSSELSSRIQHANPRLVMPPPGFGGVILTENEKRLLRKWIEQGAAYEPH
ncbi:MAG: c-type cytochrome domain-containing protein, partial [Planctomycetota bacterium]